MTSRRQEEGDGEVPNPLRLRTWMEVGTLVGLRRATSGTECTDKILVEPVGPQLNKLSQP